MTGAGISVLGALHISKSFDGVKALDDVTFDVRRGEVHALTGENGAGKSTLMKILAGQLAADSGSIEFRGERGVAMIHQELMPFLNLTVAENILIGREPGGRVPGWIDRSAMRREAAELLARLGSHLDPDRGMRGLSVAEMQMVEIARALARSAEAILMDEPTSALSARETEALFAVIRDLTAHGVAVVYTSHKMDEIFRIARRVTVLRDSRHVATLAVEELDERRLIALMVGRALEPPAGAPETIPTADRPREPALEVRNLGGSAGFRNISFAIWPGEIVGIAGLMGAGRTELAQAVFGLAPASEGEIRVKGRRVTIRKPVHAIRNGISMVTEDRKESGIVPRMSVKQNLTLASLGRVCRGGWIDRRAENRTATAEMSALSIKARGLDQEIVALSGGNQQKAMIARALLTGPEILILDEPTRGIDVGAKAEVHGLMRRLARSGKAILMISSEMPEILALSDRILVMRAGAISAELDPRTSTQVQILEFAMPERT